MPLRASSHPGSPNSPSCSALAWYSCWPGLSPWGESWKRTRVARTAALTRYHYATQPTCWSCHSRMKLVWYIWYTVETPYSTIPYTTIFYITRWTHGPQNLQRPIRTRNLVIRFLNKTNLRVISLFTARAVDSEWTHMWPATSVNNDGRTDYLRLSHLMALSARVNNCLRCIRKGLTAFLRVTPPIRSMIKQF